MLLLAGDLTDDKNVEEVVKRTVAKFTRLDVLVSTGSTLDTFGNCQRPLFSLGVSQHAYK